MSDSISEEDRRDFINEVKQGEYDAKVEDHIQAMSLEDIASIIRYNSDQLGEMFNRHVMECEDAQAWINDNAILLAGFYMNHKTIIGLLIQQIEHDLMNEAESVISDQGWM